MLNLEIRHLKLILAVTEEKSVTRAGDRLHLTQSALSHQLKDIEDRLGTKLFLRLNKKMIPTQAGERLLYSAKRILDELKYAEEEISHLANDKKGTLRLSTECYTCYHWLPELLKEFNKQYSGVDVKIVVEATQKPIQALLEGKLDIAIVSTYQQNKLLYSKPLFKDEKVVIMNPEHSLASQAYIKPADFADENLLIYLPLKESSLYKRVLLPAGIAPKHVSQVQLTEAIVEMVKAGLGISVLARWAVKSHIESGAVTARPLTKKGFQRQWYAVTRRGDSQPSYLKDFLDLLSKKSIPATS